MVLTLSNGLDIEYQRLSNMSFYKYLETTSLKVPPIPTYYIESQERWIENPDHPVYYDALRTYEIKKASLALDYMIEYGITSNIIIVNNDEWKFFYSSINNNKSEVFNYIKYMLLSSNIDKLNLIDSIFLTERRVYDIFSLIDVTRNSLPITEVDIKNKVDTGIEYQPLYIGDSQLVNPLDEYSAAVASNIDFSKWLNCELSLDEMASIIALYRLNMLVKNHSDDAAQIEAERKNKK